MSRFFYIKSNVKTTTDYRQNNRSSIYNKESKQPNPNLMKSVHFDLDYMRTKDDQKDYPSLITKKYIKREGNQNNPENSAPSVEMNFLTNYKNLRKITDNSPTFSSYNLQSKIIAANLSYEGPLPTSSSSLRATTSTSTSMQSLLASFYSPEYSTSQNISSRRNPRQTNTVRSPRTCFLENFERTQMLIRHSFIMNSNSIGNTSSYSVPNIHNPNLRAESPPSSLNKSTYDINFNLNIPQKAGFENSLSSSGIAVENEIGYEDYNLKVPYDEFQVTHFFEKTSKLAKTANLKSIIDSNGAENQNALQSFDLNDSRKRRGKKEKMSIVDSIISKYHPDQSTDFIQTKDSTDISANSIDFKKFRFDSDQEAKNNNFQFQAPKQQQQTKILIQEQDQDQELNQLSELSFSSQESLATSPSTSPSASPTSSPSSIKKGLSALDKNSQNLESEVMLSAKGSKQDDKYDEAIIISNGNKKMINLSEKLEKFRSTINIVRKTEEDFGDLLKSEEDDEETSSVKPNTLSEIKELPAEALSEPSLIFNDQLQEEDDRNKNENNENTKDSKNNENAIKGDENNQVDNS